MEGWVDSTMVTLLRSMDQVCESCSISIVPEGLKESNEDAAAYLPRVVSIGPRFKGSNSREDLVRMEKVKLRCMWSLFHRAGEVDKKLRECSEAIWNLDDQIRAIYESDIKLGRQQLADIMLVDGCFLLELLISKAMDAELPTSPAPQVLKDQHVLSDLMLLENQIPYLVLENLSPILFPNIFEEARYHRATRITTLALSVFGYHLPDQFFITELPVHMLDAVHRFVHRKTWYGPLQHVTDDTDEEQINPMLKLERCAWRLQAAGVTIKLRPNPAEDTITNTITDTDSCFSPWIRKNWNCFVGTILMKQMELDIPATAARKKLRGLDIQFEFKEGKLEIKQLHITETTKAMWQNFIAWEHHKNKTETYFGFREVGISRGKFTTAALIFNDMICCAADVRLLKDKNIIVDHVKNRSDEELVAFLRTLPFGVDHGVVDAEYVKMVDDLNNYSESCFISRMYKLFWHVLQRLVTFMHRDYNFVAALLAFLTVVQTLLAILDYFRN